MRKYYKYLKIFLFIFVLIILIFCIIRAIHRWNIEQSNRTVELVLEYREVQSVAEVLEYDIDYLMSELQSAGLNSIAISEKAKDSKYNISNLSDIDRSLVAKKIDWRITRLIRRCGLKAILRPSNSYCSAVNPPP